MARTAEDEVPEHVWRLTMYYHDLLHIKWGYMEVGSQPPAYINDQLNHVHERLEFIHKEETSQGGTFYKQRQEMSDATRSRSTQRGGRPQGRAAADGD